MYEVVEIDDRYDGESDPSDNSRWCYPDTVKYISTEERSAYALTIKNGLVYDHSGSLFDTTDAGTEHGSEGRAIFVMTSDGTVYASKNHQAGVFHHSSLLAGGAVASAGEISVVNGAVVGISNRSGHYRPPPHVADQVLDALRSQGVDVSAIALERM